MISTNDFQTGLTIEMDGSVYGGGISAKPERVLPLALAFKNVRTGAITEHFGPAKGFPCYD